MSWRRLHSRSGVPTAPRKYFVVTMLAELRLQKSGNSTPRCSKLTEPSRQFVITTSRRSQVTSSYGWTPSVVQTRASRRPLLVAARPLLPLAPPDDVPTAPVIPSPLRLRRPRRPDEELVKLRPLNGRSTDARRSYRWWRVARLASGPQRGDLPLEVRQRLERAVDAREAQIGHLVEVTQRAQDRQADVVTGYLGRTPGADRLLHPLCQQRDGVLVDRPPLAGLADASDDLRAAERFGDPAALNHREDGLLHGREPLAALRAGPPPADELTVVGLPGVDDPGVGVPAVRASHRHHLLTGTPTGADGYPRRYGCVRSCGEVIPNLWMTYTPVTTRCCGRR